jgi:hypothetical protein
LDTLRLPQLYRSLNWERLAQHLELRHNEPSLKSSPQKPSGALQVDTVVVVLVGGGIPGRVVVVAAVAVVIVVTISAVVNCCSW